MIRPIVLKIHSLYQKIKAPSTSKNRTDGKISTLLAGMLLLISESNILDQHPTANLIVDMISGAFLYKAGGHALKSK